MPSFAGAMEGLGKGLTVAGQQLGEYFSKSELQAEAAKAQALRDQTLNEYQKQAADVAYGRVIETEKRQPELQGRLTTAQRDAEAEATIRNAPGLLNVKKNEANTLADLTREQKKKDLEVLKPLETDAEIEANRKKVLAAAKPDMLAAIKASARAQAEGAHIVDPQYQLLTQPDGSVVSVNIKNPKDATQLKGPDGKPLIIRDTTMAKMAQDLLKDANQELQLAEMKYKVDAADPSKAKQAEIEWDNAKKKAEASKAPALALIYQAAKIDPSTIAKEAPAPAGAPAVGTVVNGKTFRGGDPNKRENWVAASAPTKVPGLLATPAPSAMDTLPKDAVTRAEALTRIREISAVLNNPQIKLPESEREKLTQELQAASGRIAATNQ